MNSQSKSFLNDEESSSPDLNNNELMDHSSKECFSLFYEKLDDCTGFDYHSYINNSISLNQQNNSAENIFNSNETEGYSNQEIVQHFVSSPYLEDKSFEVSYSAQNYSEDNRFLFDAKFVEQQQQQQLQQQKQASTQKYGFQNGLITKSDADQCIVQPFIIKRKKIEEKKDDNQNFIETQYNSLYIYFEKLKQKNKKEGLSNNIFEEDEPVSDNFHYLNKKEYENKKKQYILEKRRKNEEKKKSEEEALSVLKQKRKFKPIRIQQKAEYKQSLYKLIDEQFNFLFYGDMCVCKDVFTDLDIEKIKTSCCPINYFRPPVQVFKGNNYCLAQLDDTYNGTTDVNAAVHMLDRLNTYEARLISEFLSKKYSVQLSGQQEFKNKVLNHYNNDEQKIREVVAQNHQLSLKKAFDIINKLDQNKVIALHYKKVDPYTLTVKQHFVGGNTSFCNLFIGSQNLDIMSQFMSRWGLPHYMDAKGIIDLSRVIFEGGTSFTMSMVTYDDFEIPLTTTIKRINLQPFEIIPGHVLSDFLEVRLLEGNQKLIDSVHRQRYLTPQAVIEKFKLDDFHYTIEAEQFINKFYSQQQQQQQQQQQ
ncbi:hypothetical protein TTHERM_00469300 (macronuclear) [Tetrahymena thermophila SB210]|uniref:Uncharacterized protein n=1 Tax=Tetrahymena thermophila (strain SB210) TaxID=312017 RepID=I7LXL6_TETTS|nr:hypothetical protein TTHERM_00469300 [Tetrahymena thermophila SB210]EAS04881.1 hypothetical protein TTHERM_00469300 [Tetrahymena thermophila SB210]|eukprot:XP_001025126.1 hypothetical protein TTHERM_00469300 [Tetrahymena thermophila SB210]